MSTNFEPAYIRLLLSGELEERAEKSYRHLTDCDLCPRYCHMDRLHTIRGAIGTGHDGKRVHVKHD